MSWMDNILGFLGLKERQEHRIKIKVSKEDFRSWDKWNKNYCWFCGKKFAGPVDRFDCVYCGFHYCSKHRLPERHKCQGHPITTHGYRGRIKYGPGDRMTRLQ